MEKRIHQGFVQLYNKNALFHFKLMIKRRKNTLQSFSKDKNKNDKEHVFVMF